MTVRATANARALGSKMGDSNRMHGHLPSGYVSHYKTPGASSASIAIVNSGNFWVIPATDMQDGGPEARPVNTAYHPRIHA